MTAWAMKRFWTRADASPEGEGFGVRLDGKPVRTPGKAPLIVPTEALARAIAVEWDAQEGIVQPATMPFTRGANAAIDKVVPQFDEVAALIAAYGETDLLCYRAETPEALHARQVAAWDSLLEWSAADLNATLVFTHAIVPCAQPAESLQRLSGLVRTQTPFQLTALSDLVGISGSLVLGFAVARGRLDPETAWQVSRIDETWQNELWGIDEEAAAAEAIRKRDFLLAARFHALCSHGG